MSESAYGAPLFSGRPRTISRFGAGIVAFGVLPRGQRIDVLLRIYESNRIASRRGTPRRGRRLVRIAALELCCELRAHGVRADTPARAHRDKASAPIDGREERLAVGIEDWQLVDAAREQRRPI